MFNVGPMELLVLAIVGLIVVGPDKIPGLARDAARMIRTLRELATGAQNQLREELGPEFADVDLRTLNPRTALQRAILGEEGLGLGGITSGLSGLDPRNDIRDAMNVNDPAPINMSKPTSAPTVTPVNTQKPLARGEQAPYDDDAT